jgi:hypothetical protein
LRLCCMRLGDDYGRGEEDAEQETGEIDEDVDESPKRVKYDEDVSRGRCRNSSADRLQPADYPDIDSTIGLITEAKITIDDLDGPLGQLAGQMMDSLNTHMSLMHGLEFSFRSSMHHLMGNSNCFIAFCFIRSQKVSARGVLGVFRGSVE